MTRGALTEYSLTFLQAYPLLLPLALECLALDPVQFWLDCSTMPGVISAVQADNEENELFVLLKLIKNYCHGLHKARLSLLQCEYYSRPSYLFLFSRYLCDNLCTTHVNFHYMKCFVAIKERKGGEQILISWMLC